ncbi:MAG: hypothetical protein U5J63_14965 [Fodinibius sp.]|nr:hypothetical protein [Fodinibius sp.]
MEQAETPEEEVELAESLSMALLVVLDQLTPVHRAVFILREIFDYDYENDRKRLLKSRNHTAGRLPNGRGIRFVKINPVLSMIMTSNSGWSALLLMR